MAKFSGGGASSAGVFTTGPIQTTGQTVVNASGFPGYARDAKSELFVLAVANMVGEDTFYEGASARDQRFCDLVRRVSLEDPAWVARFVPYLRNEMQMRSASVVMAAEFAHTCKGAGLGVASDGGRLTIRKVVDSACVRADEPAEFVGYWLSRFGRSMPTAVKRGLADAVVRLYTERNALKYDGNSRSVRMGDVIELVHPKPKADWQHALFRLLIDQRHGRGYMLNRHPGLDMIAARAELERWPVAHRRQWLTHPNGMDMSATLARAGMTWESLAGWLQGPLDATAWEAVIPSMGYMAVLRNLRNFNQAGVASDVKRAVADRIADPAQVERSRQFPFRFLSAYKAIEGDLEYQLACERALNASLSNVPSLPGRTLILLDWSYSMTDRASGRMSDMSRGEVATLFGLALGQRAEHADVAAYGSPGSVYRLELKPGASLLPVARDWRSLGGTDTNGAIATTFRPGFHDRVLVVTDEQYNGWGSRDPFAQISNSVPCYTWNLAGYAAAQTDSRSRRHTFAGLTDKAFVMLPLLEKGESQGWPF